MLALGSTEIGFAPASSVLIPAYTGSTGLAAIHYGLKGIGTSTSCPTDSPRIGEINEQWDLPRPQTLKTLLGPLRTMEGIGLTQWSYSMGSTSCYETKPLESEDSSKYSCYTKTMWNQIYPVEDKERNTETKRKQPLLASKECALEGCNWTDRARPSPIHLLRKVSEVILNLCGKHHGEQHK